jgi:hypothetical protein
MTCDDYCAAQSVCRGTAQMSWRRMAAAYSSPTSVSARTHMSNEARRIAHGASYLMRCQKKRGEPEMTCNAGGSSISQKVGVRMLINSMYLFKSDKCECAHGVLVTQS